MYKEKTYIYKEGMEAPEDKTRIGLLKHDKNAKEYIERIEDALVKMGVRRG